MKRRSLRFRAEVGGVRGAVGAALAVGLAFVTGAGCATMPDPKVERYSLPKQIYVEKVARPHERIGAVKARVDFVSLDSKHEFDFLCRNYYNKAARDLLKFAKQKGADAVAEVRSIVFLEDGRVENYKTAECSDDGAEGQILLHGVAIKWKPCKDAEGREVECPAEPEHAKGAGAGSGSGSGSGSGEDEGGVSETSLMPEAFPAASPAPAPKKNGAPVPQPQEQWE